jgi:hypothetical protein
MSNKLLLSALAICLLAAAPLGAQSLNLKIDLAKDSPVTLLSLESGDSTATARGGAYQVNVHASLSLRNSSQKKIRGVTMAVLAQEVTPGGKGSVSVPSLDVTPNDAFTVRIDVPLIRPLGAGQGIPAVEVRLDGVLFEDLSFYGPDSLHSKHNMTLWELEARRDRKYFKSVLETAGDTGLRNEMLRSLSREADRQQQQPGMQMVRGRSTNIDAGQDVQFAFLDIPESPAEALGGTAKITSDSARAPRFEVRNRSTRPIRSLEIGWLVKDQQGREFLAASLPAEANLAPGKTGQVLEQDTALKFRDSMNISAMRGFVSNVEFADGGYWIPSRATIDDPKLRSLVAPSPEEQRLAQIYRKKGLAALVEELKKF